MFVLNDVQPEWMLTWYSLCGRSTDFSQDGEIPQKLMIHTQSQGRIPINSLCCSCRGSEFCSQHSNQVAHKSRHLNSRGAYTLFWPPWVLHSCTDLHTDTRIYTKKNLTLKVNYFPYFTYPISTFKLFSIYYLRKPFL